MVFENFSPLEIDSQFMDGTWKDKLLHIIENKSIFLQTESILIGYSLQSDFLN